MEQQQNALPEAAGEQLSLLNSSLWYLEVLLAGLLLRWALLGRQREELLASVFCPPTGQPPNFFPWETAAALLVLYSLFGFYGISQRVVEQTARSGGCEKGPSLDLLLSGIVLLVGLIRTVRFFLQAGQGQGEKSQISGEEALGEVV